MRHPATWISIAALIIALLLGALALWRDEGDTTSVDRSGGCLVGSGRIINGSVDLEDLSPAARKRLKGAIGQAGAAGTVGPQGSTGATGAQGGTGSSGPRGKQGKQGSQGATGAQGPKGDTGDQGPKGDTGASGAAGAKGDTGATGPQGEKGDTGATGAQGEKGDKGDTGLSGTSVLSGDVGPDPGIGNLGDFYIDTTTYTIYGPKTGAGWGTGTCLIGPAGGGVPPYQGALYSTSSQSVNADDSPTPIVFQEEDPAVKDGVSWGGVGDPSLVRITHAGIYNFQWSAQLNMGVNNTHTVFIWPKVNGVVVPWSNTSYTLNTNKDRIAPALNYVFALPANSTFELLMASSEDTMEILADPAPASGPEIPGIILTVTRVG